MSTIKKRLLSVTLAVAVAFGLAACDPADDDTGTTTTTTVPGTPDTTDPTDTTTTTDASGS